MSFEDNNDCCIGTGRFVAMMSFVTFLIYAAAVSSPAWIEQEFTTPPKAIAAASSIPQIKVNSEIGLLWACTDRAILSPLAPQTEEKCESLADIDSDMVEDWQWIAAGLGIGALVFSFVCIFLSCCLARRGQRDICLRVTSAVLYLLSCGLVIASLVLFTENKEFDTLVKSQKVDYDYYWGFYIAAVSAVLFFLLAAVNACTPCCMVSNNSGNNGVI